MKNTGLEPVEEMINARRISLALTAAAIAMPLVSLIGWVTGIMLLASYGERFIPMAPSTAICLILLALPLLIALRPRRGPVGSQSAGLAGGLIALYGFLVFSGWLTGWPINPDDVLFKEMGTMETYPLGRMSPSTGVLFLLSGLSLSALARGLSRPRHANDWLSLAGVAGFSVVLIGMIFTLGYTLSEPLLYGAKTIPMALATSFSFIFLGGALATAGMLYSPVSGRWFRTLNDMSISRQLRLGLGLILAFVLFLGVLAWKQTDLLRMQTKTMYDHLFQVQNAVGDFEIDVLIMHRGMRELLLAESGQGAATVLQDLDAHKADVFRQLEILRNRYLGPPEDIISLHKHFVTWNSIREETIRLWREGKTEEAAARTKSSGVGGVQLEVVRDRLRKIGEFAKNKADQLYLDAGEHANTIKRQLIVAITFIVLLSLLASYVLLRGITGPLAQLTAAADQFRQGKRKVRSGYISDNELGALSAAFNLMADTIETEVEIKEKQKQELVAQTEELQAQSEELQAQTEELQAQTEELLAQTEELERQRLRVEEADRLKSEFLSNMSHELRTPLNSVLALTQLMMTRGTGKDVAQEAEYLQVIERNGRHLLNLINDILDIGRIESGCVQLVLREIAPGDTCDRALEMVRPLAADRGLELKTGYGHLPRISTDEDKLQQILINLLSNAVKFTDQGEIELAVEAAGDRMRFIVRDTGVGIAPEVLPSIFDKFRQVDGSFTRRFEGTGLGLAICRSLAKILGGEITVESLVGRGSTFTLTLPQICPEPQEAAEVTPVIQSPPAAAPFQPPPAPCPES